MPVTHRYDADGIRVAKTLDGVETRYLIDANRPYAQVLEEIGPAGASDVSYVYGNDLIAQLRDGQASHYHVDGLGSTRALSDAGGVMTDSYTYDAYGRTIGRDGVTENFYQYAGEQRDADMGLDYLRARYLDVGAGRFASRDPFTGNPLMPMSLHDYQYAFDNPIVNLDPTGEQTLISVSTTVLAYNTLAGAAFSSVQTAISYAPNHRKLGEKPAIERTVTIHNRSIGAIADGNLIKIDVPRYSPESGGALYGYTLGISFGADFAWSESTAILYTPRVMFKLFGNLGSARGALVGFNGALIPFNEGTLTGARVGFSYLISVPQSLKGGGEFDVGLEAFAGFAF